MDTTDNTMKIRAPRTDSSQGSQKTNQASGDARANSSLSKSTATGSDMVTFTATAAEMLKLGESLANIPDIDNSRVDTIKASIAEGSYQIDPDKIVDSLLSIERDLT